MKSDKKLIVILGPTASGKTLLAIEAARHFQTEIISADSRQFFRELNIGVARPSLDELAAAKHHFIAFKSIHEYYSAGQYERDALDKLSEIFTHSDYAVCVGGSTLYLQALISGLDDLPSDAAIKSTLQEEINSDGLAALVGKLTAVDPEYAARVDLNNPHRVIRALEVYSLTGKKYSELRKSETQTRPFKIIKFGIDPGREILYDRINKRVDRMIADRLIDEAKGLLEFANINALQTVGYTELFDHFNGSMTLDEAIEKIKQHTRNYAKRQMTWWRRDQEINWLRGTGEEELQRMFNITVQL